MFAYLLNVPWWLRKAYPDNLIWEMPAEQEPSVYVTFDDGPHPEITPFVIEQLAAYNAKATFFCVGNNVTRYPDAFRQIKAAGHTAANHTYNHVNGWKKSTSDYLADISRAHDCVRSNLFRPPYGKIKWSQVKALREAHPDWKIIMWNVLSADFDKNISPEQCLENVLKYVRPGSIILLHDSEKAWERMRYALPRVLAHCEAKGWKMKAIPQ